MALPSAVLADVSDLRITELMYHAPDEGAIDGDEYDFIEIKNTGVATVSLAGVSFQDGIQFTFSSSESLPAGAFAVLVANSTRFAERYPSVPIAGVYQGVLRNSGERVRLVANGDTIASVRYNDDVPWPVVADGNGRSIVPDGTSSETDLDDADYWRASANALGSPGADDPTPTAIPAILVNELLPHTDLPNVDAVELYNPTSSPVDIGNWYLSDNRQMPKLYQFPAGTTIPANGYHTVYESEINTGPTAFSFNRSGEWVFLWSANSAGELTGYAHGWDYAAQFNPVSYGIYETSQGDKHFVAQESTTLGAVNSAPKVGPVVFTQIMYHPASGTQEFVALQNITSNPVELYSWQSADTTWRVEGLAFAFPSGTEMQAGETVYLTNHNPWVFRNTHGLGASVQVFQYTGSLNNDGEFLGLYAPDNFDTTQTGAIWAPQVLVDGVRYNDAAPWPAQADGGGLYLQRITATEYGNDPINWEASNNPVGLEEEISKQSLQVWPIPATEQTWVRWNSTEPAAVTLRDVSGRAVLRLTGQQNQCQLPVKGLAPGLYMVEVQQRTTRSVAQIVVQ